MCSPWAVGSGEGTVEVARVEAARVVAAMAEVMAAVDRA